MRLHFSFSKIFQSPENFKFKIALLVPSNRDSAPNKIAYWIANYLSSHNVLVILFWIDNFKDGLYEADKNFTKLSIYDYDIVHSHLLRPDISLALRILKYKFSSIFKVNKSVKFITTLHSDIYSDLRSDNNLILTIIVYFIWIFFLKFFDIVVVLTNNMKFKYEGLFSYRIKVIYNGISFSSKINQERNISISDFSFINIGYIGSLRKIKGVDLLLHSFSKLPRNFILNIAGSGPEHSALQKIVDQNLLGDRVRFYGHVKDIKSFILLNEIFIFPSRSEGFCLAALDVLFLNKPIILSKIPTFEELYADPSFLKFNLNNSSELIDSINELSLNYYDYLQKQRSFVSKRYTDSVMGNNYFNLYCRVLNIN